MGKETEDAHDLMPPNLRATIPRLHATEGVQGRMVHLKWFTPDSFWTWFVLEFDPSDGICFGLVDGLERELGYFSLDEIEQLRGPLGLRVERDLYWQPKPLLQC